MSSADIIAELSESTVLILGLLAFILVVIFRKELKEVLNRLSSFRLNTKT